MSNSRGGLTPTNPPPLRTPLLKTLVTPLCVTLADLEESSVKLDRSYAQKAHTLS